MNNVFGFLFYSMHAFLSNRIVMEQSAVITILLVGVIAILIFSIVKGCKCKRWWHDDGMIERFEDTTDLTDKETELFEDLSNNKLSEDEIMKLVKSGIINDNLINKFLVHIDNSFKDSVKAGVKESVKDTIKERESSSSKKRDNIHETDKIQKPKPPPIKKEISKPKSVPIEKHPEPVPIKKPVENTVKKVIPKKISNNDRSDEHKAIKMIEPFCGWSGYHATKI